MSTGKGAGAVDGADMIIHRGSPIFVPRTPAHQLPSSVETLAHTQVIY
jgi:hypothetical protein